MNFVQTHKWVENNPWAEWDGWYVVVFTPDSKAQYRNNGMRKFGQWGFVERYICNNRGEWLIDTD